MAMLTCFAVNECILVQTRIDLHKDVFDLKTQLKQENQWIHCDASLLKLYHTKYDDGTWLQWTDELLKQMDQTHLLSAIQCFLNVRFKMNEAQSLDRSLNCSDGVHSGGHHVVHILVATTSPGEYPRPHELKIDCSGQWRNEFASTFMPRTKLPSVDALADFARQPLPVKIPLSASKYAEAGLGKYILFIDCRSKDGAINYWHNVNMFLNIIVSNNIVAHSLSRTWAMNLGDSITKRCVLVRAKSRMTRMVCLKCRELHAGKVPTCAHGEHAECEHVEVAVVVAVEHACLRGDVLEQRLVVTRSGV